MQQLSKNSNWLASLSLHVLFLLLSAEHDLESSIIMTATTAIRGLNKGRGGRLNVYLVHMNSLRFQQLHDFGVTHVSKLLAHGRALDMQFGVRFPSLGIHTRQ